LRRAGLRLSRNSAEAGYPCPEVALVMDAGNTHGASASRRANGSKILPPKWRHKMAEGEEGRIQVAAGEDNKRAAAVVAEEVREVHQCHRPPDRRNH